MKISKRGEEKNGERFTGREAWRERSPGRKKGPVEGDHMKHCCCLCPRVWLVLHVTSVGIKIPILNWGNVAQSVKLET